MFLNVLEPREKIAFLALAKKLILSDEDIADSEVVLLKSMRKEMEIIDEVMGDEITEEDIDSLPDDIPLLCKEFRSKKSKISALMELIGLSFVDGKFVPRERKIIYEVAAEFDISKTETESYIDWAARLFIGQKEKD